MKWKIILVARVKLSTKCNFIFVSTGNGDAILFPIDYYFTTIVAGPSILEKGKKEGLKIFDAEYLCSDVTKTFFSFPNFDREKYL